MPASTWTVSWFQSEEDEPANMKEPTYRLEVKSNSILQVYFTESMQWPDSLTLTRELEPSELFTLTYRLSTTAIENL